MGSDRSHWERVSDGDSSRADLAAANVKIAEMAREMGQIQTELEQSRSARAASAERVRDVVAEAAIAVLERAGIKEPHSSSDADAIATRAAEQLATAAVGLSAEERGAILRMRGRISEMPPMGNGDEVALSAVLERLLASPPATDLHSAILTILDGDMPAGDLRKALAELVGHR